MPVENWNREVLVKTRAAIAAEPERFDMRDFIRPLDDSSAGWERFYDAADLCGTTCCIAGHAALAAGASIREVLRAGQWRGRVALGLDSWEADSLFFGGSVWDRYRDSLGGDPLYTIRPEHAIALLDDMIAGVDVFSAVRP